MLELTYFIEDRKLSPVIVQQPFKLDERFYNKFRLMIETPRPPHLVLSKTVDESEIWIQVVPTLSQPHSLLIAALSLVYAPPAT